MNPETFRGELLQNEKVLWSGQPDTSVIFSSSDIFQIPFSLLWGGFALFWEYSVVTQVATSPAAGFASIIFPLFGIPFVLMGLYFIFGRFFYKNFKKKRTYYAVTDKRILILTTLFGKRCNAVFINTIPAIQKSIQSNGTGSLIFGNTNPQSSMYANSGMEVLSGFRTSTAPAFYDIKNAETVYKQVNDLRNKAQNEP